MPGWWLKQQDVISSGSLSWNVSKSFSRESKVNRRNSTEWMVSFHSQTLSLYGQQSLVSKKVSKNIWLNYQQLHTNLQSLQTIATIKTQSHNTSSLGKGINSRQSNISMYFDFWDYAKSANLTVSFPALQSFTHGEKFNKKLEHVGVQIPNRAEIWFKIYAPPEPTQL